MIPHVDLIVLSRESGPLRPEVEAGIRRQQGVRLSVHRVVGQPREGDHCRWETIARTRNAARFRGRSPWLMYLDDDVVLHPQCIATLVSELSRRPLHAALAADYLGEQRPGRVAPHVAMGATLFRREVLNQVRFTWNKKQCECQCCCDDLRSRHFAIDYCSAAKARHLPKGSVAASKRTAVACAASAVDATPRGTSEWDLLNPSVCLVVCYLGPPPGWIQHYLLSCAYNPSIHFLIVTDQEDFPAAPPNVRVERVGMASFNALASAKIGLQVDLPHSRKLCDFKPTYGHVFEEWLAGYDYWGYADLDVIYGDVRRFLAAERLHTWDVYTAREEFLVGHFTLFRNTPRMRTLYRESADLEPTLKSEAILGFDECGWQWGRRKQGKPLIRDGSCDSMTHIVHRLMARHELSARFAPTVVELPGLTGRNWRIQWRTGQLCVLSPRREAMYAHFHTVKNRPGYRDPVHVDRDSGFDLTPSGIVPVKVARREAVGHPAAP